MNKKIYLLLISQVIGVVVFSQQMPSFTDILKDNFQNKNKDVFMNRKLLTPTNLTDSGKVFIDIVFYDQLAGYTGGNKGFSVFGETCFPKLKSSIGLNINFYDNDYFKHHAFSMSYKYNFLTINNSNFEAGLNLSLWQHKWNWDELVFNEPDPILSNAEKWKSNSLVDAGIAYKYKNQKLKITYNNFIDIKIEDFDRVYHFKINGWIASYEGLFQISKNISITPEIYGCFYSGNQYAIIATRVIFVQKVTCGILYNTSDSYGFTVSGIIKKRFKLGYYFDINNKSSYNYTYGSHELNVGFILR